MPRKKKRRAYVRGHAAAGGRRVPAESAEGRVCVAHDLLHDAETFLLSDLGVTTEARQVARMAVFAAHAHLDTALAYLDAEIEAADRRAARGPR